MMPNCWDTSHRSPSMKMAVKIQTIGTSMVLRTMLNAMVPKNASP